MTNISAERTVCQTEPGNLFQKSWKLSKEHFGAVILRIFGVWILWLLTLTILCKSTFVAMDLIGNFMGLNEPGFNPFAGLIFIVFILPVILIFIAIGLAISIAIFRWMANFVMLVVKNVITQEAFTCKKISRQAFDYLNFMKIILSPFFILEIVLIIVLVFIIDSLFLGFAVSVHLPLLFSSAILFFHIFHINCVVFPDLNDKKTFAWRKDFFKKHWFEFFSANFFIMVSFLSNVFFTLLITLLLVIPWDKVVALCNPIFSKLTIMFSLLLSGFICLLVHSFFNVFMTVLFLNYDRHLKEGCDK